MLGVHEFIFLKVKNMRKGKKGKKKKKSEREYKSLWHLSGQNQTNKNKNKERTDMFIIEIEASQSAKPAAI